MSQAWIDGGVKVVAQREWIDWLQLGPPGEQDVSVERFPSQWHKVRDRLAIAGHGEALAPLYAVDDFAATVA